MLPILATIIPTAHDGLRDSFGRLPLHYHPDGIISGRTTALTGTTGKLVERITYDGYGNSAGSTRSRYGYTGRERDPLTSLLYYRARFYDPQLGRFISEDPIGLEGGDVNLYAYVLNNPANFRDPTGRQRADRDRPGDREWARGLKKAIDRMPTPQEKCGCQSKPRNPLLLAGAIAVADGPQPGITDILAVGLLLTYAFGTSQTMDCTPPRVIPFPKPEPQPTPLIPPLGPNNPPRDRDKEDKCFKRCEHLLGLPGDYGNRFRKCYRECMGTL